MSDLFDFYPYAERFGVTRALPDSGRSREEILTELRTMASEEDAVWEDGRCSGTMYCGDRDHYAFLKEAFGLFAHQNALQRDMCPSATRFEGEIIAMALDLIHAGARSAAPSRRGWSPRAARPASPRRSSPTGSRGARSAGSTGRTWSSRRPATPPSTRPATCSGSRCAARRSIPETTLVRPEGSRSWSTSSTVAIVGSAGNYGYGTIDPIAELGELALERGVGLHVDGCLGGYLLPFGEELGYPIPPFDFRVPGVTQHLRRHPQVRLRRSRGPRRCSSATATLRNRCYFFMPDWSGGKYFSPGMDGSRSDGLLAATWASMVSIGREGYRELRAADLRDAAAMQEAVRSHPELRLLGEPTFLFAFTSDEFDIYHVNDEMKRRGWRFNGLQYPNALHMAVTRPQTQPGVVEVFAADLDAAVAYAREHARRAGRVERDLRRGPRRPQRRGRGDDPSGDGRS